MRIEAVLSTKGKLKYTSKGLEKIKRWLFDVVGCMASDDDSMPRYMKDILLELVNTATDETLNNIIDNCLNNFSFRVDYRFIKFVSNNPDAFDNAKITIVNCPDCIDIDDIWIETDSKNYPGEILLYELKQDDELNIVTKL